MRDNSTIAHHRVLEDIAVHLPARRVIEIGVSGGRTTLPLLRAMRETNGHLWSLDIASCRKARRRVVDLGFSAWWTFVKGCSWDWSGGGTEPFDLIFIDGDHASVAKDWEVFEPRVRPEGLVILHDYFGGCTEACGTCPACRGTRELVDQTIRPQWPRWECATLPYSYGLTLVRKR